MLDDFNILATTARGNERAMCNELLYLLKEELGDVQAKTAKTKIRGLIVGNTALDPIEVVEKFRVILAERPYSFRYALRIVPIQKVVQTDLAEIKMAAHELSSKIEKHQSFRVTVEKRFTALHSREIIEAAVEDIDLKVELREPDWILQIEVLGALAGVSLLRSYDIISVMKEKML
jgi:tRNA acetyltransferase TAN1